MYSYAKDHDCINESLWHNRYILVDNTPMYYKEWDQHKISIIKDILDKHGNMLSKEQIEKKYGLNIKHMMYNSLSSAIPRNWKHNVNLYPKIMDGIIYVYQDECIRSVKELYCRDFCSLFLQNKVETPKAELKWNKYLGVTNDDWDAIYCIPFTVTRDTAIQSLQFKILHRYYPCNYVLSKWYKDQSSQCSYCNEIDYIEHYFYSCASIKRFWNSVQKWWLHNIECSIQLSKEDVVLGMINVNNDKMLDIFNLCMLIAKWHIVKCRKDNVDPDLYDFLRHLKYVMEMEKIYYKMENRTNIFIERWNILYECLH